MAELKKIGFIGAGKMGKGIVKTLLEKSYPVFLLAHRNRKNIDELLERGAQEVSSQNQLLEAVQVVITCLPDPPAIKAVFEGDQGILSKAQAKTVIIDTSTSDPELTRHLQTKATERDIDLIDAGLLGVPKMTWEGKVGLAVGGTSDAIEKAMPILEAFSNKIFIAGGPGSGHTLKLINNAVTLTNSAILYETFAVAKKSGVDLNMLYQALDTSAASSKRLHMIAPNLIEDQHPLSFALDVASKDLVLYTTFAGESGVPTLVSDATKSQYRLAQSMGYGKENVTRVATALAKLADGAF